MDNQIMPLYKYKARNKLNNQVIVYIRSKSLSCNFYMYYSGISVDRKDEISEKNSMFTQFLRIILKVQNTDAFII